MGFISGKQIKSKIRIENSLIREGLAEFLGTFILCTFGCASLAMFVTPPNLNSNLSISLGWGFGATMALWCCAGVSAGHINPAATLATAIIGRTQWVKVPVYWLGQYLGAFCAAVCVFGVFYDAINAFDGGKRQVFGPNATAGIFGSYPQAYMSTGGALGDQVVGTMLLVLCVMAITDTKNMGVPRPLVPVCIGLVIMLIGITFGVNCGCPINPARDFAPRVFTVIAGYGGDCFSAYNYYFWIPIVGPHIGALCGAWMYLILVGAHIPDEADKYEVEDDMKSGKISEMREVTVDAKYATEDPASRF